MNGQAIVIHRFALFFMAVAAAVASNLWAQHDHAPAAQRTADTTLAEWLADKDARVSELIGRRVVNPGGQLHSPAPPALVFKSDALERLMG